VIKFPWDLWIYQEIIYELRPDVIIETGTFMGGSALFLASICDLINNGKVITIDIRQFEPVPNHKRITYLHGSSTSNAIVCKLKDLISPTQKVMVILDSEHYKTHVLEELKIYSQFVSIGQYLIVEDTDFSLTNEKSRFKLTQIRYGPLQAINEFLKDNHNFVIYKSGKKSILTYTIFLKRKA
jgi:cephalosporin hydroxylase